MLKWLSFEKFRMEEWFRQTRWTEKIEREFFAKLAKARRQRDQYLVIQALTLAKTHPEVALRLTSLYFESKRRDFEDVRALEARARANLGLGREGDAIATMKEILVMECTRPGIRTNTYTEFPYFVATHRIKHEYEGALNILESRKTDLAFPISHFQWHAAMSLISADRGDHEVARTHAAFAVQAASAKKSGFHYHPELGLVGEEYAGVLAELRELAR